MAGTGGLEKVSNSLTRYLERRLLDGSCQDHQRSFPAGYRVEFHYEAHVQVVRHEASGTCCCLHALDLVERVDRGKRHEPARFAYIYLTSSEVFVRASASAHREPHKTWKMLVEARVFTPSEDAVEGTWYSGPISVAEPSRACGDQSLPAEWRAAPYCLAVHLPAVECRVVSPGSSRVELWLPGGAPHEASAGAWVWPPVADRAPQVERGVRLVEAAARRDPAEVRSLLEARTNPDFQDSRGWTALHAACAVRPQCEVLNQLLEVCDVCVRTHSGLLACDIADMGNNEDTALAVKEAMQLHKKGKYLPAASSTLTQAAKAALGLTHIDYSLGAQMGKRRDDGESETMLRDFANLLMTKYNSSDHAFKAFDFNRNGTLSGAEFVQSAKQLQFPGDPTSVFKAIDLDRQGDISKVEFRTLQRLYDEEQLAKKSKQWC